MKKFIIFFPLLLSMFSVLSPSSAKADSTEILSANTIVKAVLGNESTDSDSKILFHESLNEFLSLTKISRPSFHTEKIFNYLQDWANSHHFVSSHDSAGNLWFDVPATAGFESFPKVILQCHMDMVCVNQDGSAIDFNNFCVTPVLKEKTLIAKNTSLGADDGIGIGLALAIAKGQYKHGPLRILITTDEEVGCIGASKVNPKALDAPYLINLDNEALGEIIISSAGSLIIRFEKTNNLIKTEGTRIQLNLSGLRSGHSGEDINKNRLSAISFIRFLFNELQRNSVPYYLENVKSGTVGNAISGNAILSFFILQGDEEKTSKTMQAVLQKFTRDYPEEKIDLKIEKDKKAVAECLSVEDSYTFMSMLTELPQGVLAMSKEIEDFVETSSNIGIVNLINGKAEITVYARSCKDAQLETLKNAFNEAATKRVFSSTILGYSPSWPPKAKSKLISLMAEAYKATGTPPIIRAIHAGLECGDFAKAKPEIQLISIGPTLKNGHSTSETLYLDTVYDFGKALIYILEHISQ